MSKNLIAVLVGAVVFLALLLILQSPSDRAERRYLFDGLAEHANDIESVHIQLSGDDAEEIRLRKIDDTWRVASRFDYPADVSKLGRFVTELSEANIVEEKTSNPDNYSRLGVDDPGAGGSGIKVSLEAEEIAYELILGKRARGNLRYARIPDEATSFLVDRELNVGESQDDWLRRELVDIPAERIRKVTITHADGETVSIGKLSEDDSNFTVLDIPEGREQSYDTVANGIAGALANLGFETVQKASDADAATTSVFETSDGLRIEIRIAEEDDASWLEFSVAGEGAESIRERLDGWRYRIADHKANLLQRRLEDLLKPIS